MISGYSPSCELVTVGMFNDDNAYTSKSDIWLFAVLMWELVTVGMFNYVISYTSESDVCMVICCPYV